MARPHISDFSALHHVYFPDEDDNNADAPFRHLFSPPVDYNLVNLNMQQMASLQYYMQHDLLFTRPVNGFHHNLVSLTAHQNTSLQYYMQHVLRIQYLHTDGSIDNIIWKLIHSSDSAREAACLLADLHHKSTQGAIDFIAPADHDVYARIQKALVVPVTEGELLQAFAWSPISSSLGHRGSGKHSSTALANFRSVFSNGIMLHQTGH
jgi:hypothetical protein